MPQNDDAEGRAAGRLVDISLDDGGLPPPTPEIEQERRVAIFDLIEGNVFELAGGAEMRGPYRLVLRPDAHSIGLEVTSRDGGASETFRISAAPYAQVIRDYHQICQSYLDAVRHLPPAQIETIDAARRSIHEEGARRLIEELAGKVWIDPPTARRLFTLVAVLRVET